MKMKKKIQKLLIWMANDKMINNIKDNQIIILIKIKNIYYCLLKNKLNFNIIN